MLLVVTHSLSEGYVQRFGSTQKEHVHNHGANDSIVADKRPSLDVVLLEYCGALYLSQFTNCISLCLTIVLLSVPPLYFSRTAVAPLRESGRYGGNRNQMLPPILKRFWISAAISIKSHFPSFQDRKVASASARSHKVESTGIDNLKTVQYNLVHCPVFLVHQRKSFVE